MSENNKGHKIVISHFSKEEWVPIIWTFIVYVVSMFAYFMVEHMYSVEEIEKTLHVTEEAAEHGLEGYVFAIIMLICSIFFIFINRHLLVEQLDKAMHHKKEVIFWAVIGAFLVFAIQETNVLLFHGPHHAYTKVSGQMAGILSPLLIISTCFGVAFVEEVSYKVICYMPIEEVRTPDVYILSAVFYGLLNAIIFGAIGSNMLGAFLLYTALGLKFGFLYSRTHTIYTSILAGTLYSVVATLILFI